MPYTCLNSLAMLAVIIGHIDNMYRFKAILMKVNVMSEVGIFKLFLFYFTCC